MRDQRLHNRLHGTVYNDEWQGSEAPAGMPTRCASCGASLASPSKRWHRSWACASRPSVTGKPASMPRGARLPACSIWWPNGPASGTAMAQPRTDAAVLPPESFVAWLWETRRLGSVLTTLDGRRLQVIY